jgi:hypothetical protein
MTQLTVRRLPRGVAMLAAQLVERSRLHRWLHSFLKQPTSPMVAQTGFQELPV